MSAPTYTIELGDVLMSVQRALLREDAWSTFGRPAARPAAPQPTTASVRPLVHRPAARTAPVAVPVPAPSAPASAVRTLRPAPAPHPVPADPLPPERLRPRFKLVGLAIRFGEELEDSAKETILGLLIEAAMQALRADDVVYRTGPAELAFLLRDADEAGADAAVARVEASARRLLWEHAVRTPFLARVPVEPGVVLSVRHASVPA
jgi:hypothetical protein